ncbi:MAG: decaprenylphospho-beta-D-erythro-pentofuranosid-2-ulose 2-reductase [Chloroflexota bacterium]
MKDAVGAVQRVLVLGGDSDIANALIKRLAKGRTRSVILAGRDTEALERRAQHWREHGLNASTLSFDALEFESHPEFVERAFADGDIDLVFVAFGVLGDQKEDERDPKKAVQVIQTNFTGAVSVMIPLVERLKTQGHGTVAVMSSVAAERPRRSNFIYGASKAGIDWFSQGLGDALQGSGVHVMVVRAGFARSKMTEGLDTPPMASTPDEIAAAVVDALRKNREIVWVPGKLRWVMSVLRHLPRPIFRKLNI